jgi:hypothetical protein
MKRISIFVFSALLFAACGGGSKAPSEAETDSATMEEHNHDHGSMTSGNEVPAVPEGARVFFANLEDGATVNSPFYVEFGAEGVEVEPAGLVKEGFGHHHIIINGGAIPFGEAVPADDTHIHYGGGQTGDTLSLDPGTYSLTMQFADGIHRSYGEALAATISVTVE